MAIVKLLLLAATFNFIRSIEGGNIFRQKRSDDTNLEALEAIVQQLAAHSQQQEAKNQQQEEQIQTLQAKVTVLENRLPSLSMQVAFTVHFSKDAPTNGIALGPQQTLIFDSVVTNIGNGYNIQNGIFTAPVSGIYIFFLTIMSTNGHGYVTIAVVKGGSVLDIAYAEGQTNINDQGSTHVSTHLQSGQQVWARQDGGGAVRGSWWSVFTGYLIQAD